AKRAGTAPGPTPYRKQVRLERPRDGLDVEALDDVAGADILVVGEGHAALLPRRHLAHLVLKALERRQRTLVDNDVIPDQAHARTTLDLALGDPAAGDLADPGNVEHLEDLRVAEENLAQGRRQQPRHRRLHVVDQIVDDVVVADLHSRLVGEHFRLRV